MDNGPPALGLEDGTIDVERLLVEPQGGHASMDSVICFNEKIEKIPGNAMDKEEISRSFGGSDTVITQEGEDILNGEVLDAMPNEDEDGYFRLRNDFYSMGEDYLLGVEFAESITDIDYGSSEGLEASFSDSRMLVSSAGADTPWKSDVFRIMEVPHCQNDQFNVGSYELRDIPCRRQCETLTEEKPLISPTSCTLQNIGKFHHSSSCSFQKILSDESDGRLSPSGEMFYSPKFEKKDEFELTGPDGETNTFQGQEALATMPAQASCTNVLPREKRSRKPTQRYIDELADPISTYSKKRRAVSSSTIKDKSVGVEDHKKCHMGSKAMRLPAEESTVKAIQVPFGSLVLKECPKGHAHDIVHGSDSRSFVTKSKDNSVTPENQKKRDQCIAAVHLKKRDDCVMTATQKKRDDCVTAAHLNKRDGRLTAASQKKKDNRVTALSQKKRDDCLNAETPEEVSGRRKHHRVWTITEVRKLIDGVSQYGVGRWSRIKKLFFSTSAHRTSVDLKDKWRNLLKASGIQEQGNRQGEKKRNLAWRPLPKSILRRVCELATMYPYPKGQSPKIAHIHHQDSPDRSTDITLGDYRRILRSINDN